MHCGLGITELGADLFECRAGLHLRLLNRAEKPEQELIFLRRWQP
jgi:hypothetical protein